MILQDFKQLARWLFVGGVLAFAPLTAQAADDQSAAEEESVAEMVLKDCGIEIEDFCGTVTPGRGRIVACLYAHNDQLSELCEGALEIGIIQFKIIMSAVSHVAEQCSRDLEKHCEGLEVGGGQIYQCLVENKDNLEENCREAFAEAQDDLQ